METAITTTELHQQLDYYRKLADELGGTNISYDARIAAATSEVRKLNEGLALLNQLQQSIDVKDTMQSVFESTMAAINVKLRMDRSVILMEREDGNFTAEHWLGYDETTAATLPGQTLNIGNDLLSRDDYWLVTKAAPAQGNASQITTQLGIPFFIAVPIYIHQQRVGILVSGRMKEIRPFFPTLSTIEAGLFQTIGAFLSVSATNSGAYHILEELVAERTHELTVEKEKSDTLLLNILPAEVAAELKERGEAKAKLYDHVTVLFTDFVGFTTAAERFTPEELVLELHSCFKAFDEIISGFGIEKIKTIGDAYLAVAGLPLAMEDHAIKAIKAAMEIRDFMESRQKNRINAFHLRIGVHSGNVVAGIVGVKKFAYDIWGDTVNIAARMEQNSEAGKINISHATWELVKDHIPCEYRGEIAAKNKGTLKMYFVK